MEELLFALSTLLVLPFWLLMIVAPGWQGTRRVVRSPWMLVPLPVIYVVLLAANAPQLATILAEPSTPLLVVLSEILGTPIGATIAWIHFLAIDLFVGRWEYFDSQDRGYSPWVVAPAMWATLFLGPAGLLIYLGLRTALGRQKPQKPAAPKAPVSLELRAERN
jgi:hypothetical protein